MTASKTGDSGRLVRYLLGQLGESEAAEIEERYFRDDEEFARLEVTADDLADRYAAGRMPEADRLQFERHCLGSQDDRLRVRVAKALRRRAAGLRAEKRVSFLQSLTELFRVQGPVIRLASAAAGLVVLVGASVLGLRVAQLQQELARVRNEMSAELAAERETGSGLIQQERAQRQGLEERLRDLTTVNFVLMPGTDRGSGTDLVVGRDATFVRFNLALERPSASGRYRVTLRTVERATVWSQDVTATVSAASPSLVVTIPSAIVSTGQYEIVLQGIEVAGLASEIAMYGFRIVRARSGA